MDFLYNNFIANFFSWMLQWLFDNVTHDYILAVFIVLLVVKLVTLPLDLRQRRSMNRMAALKPKIDSIKKRYPDPQVQQKKISELYKKENIKPMAGCLPMLIQLPVLFALFGALRALSNIQMADIVVNASQDAGDIALPNVLWVHNMWQPDSGMAKVMPTLDEWTRLLGQMNDTFVTSSGATKAQLIAIDYQPIFDRITAQYGNVGNGWFVLPLAQVGLQILQTKLASTAQPDQPGGKTMTYIMSLFMGYICIISSVVFNLYWLFSSVYAIIQTLILNKFVFKTKGPDSLISAN